MSIEGQEPQVDVGAGSPDAPGPAVETLTIPEPPAAKSYFWGTGRRKRAVARVRIRPGKGEITVNKRGLDKYFSLERDRNNVVAPLMMTETAKKVDVFVNVHGGGTTGQAGAIMLGITRALKEANKDYESTLRDKGYLTRDDRKVERKKYGQRKARKRFQFSKR